MQIVVKADDSTKQAWEARPMPAGISTHWLQAGEPIPAADAYVDLSYDESEVPVFKDIVSAPVFVNAVTATTGCLPANSIRINGWPGFLEQETIEISAANEAALRAGIAVLEALQWKYVQAPDTPGMVSARVISMIVNEAYFALGEKISTKTEIDTAMKLGTNYPYGPFEWSARIGLKKIYRLLQQLAAKDTRYSIAPLLEKEATQTF